MAGSAERERPRSNPLKAAVLHRGDFVPQGDACQCLESTSGIQRNAAEHLAIHRAAPCVLYYLAPNVSAKVGTPYFMETKRTVWQ